MESEPVSELANVEAVAGAPELLDDRRAAVVCESASDGRWLTHFTKSIGESRGKIRKFADFQPRSFS